MSKWQSDNIMNNTIWDYNLNKYIKYDKIKYENYIDLGINIPSYGILNQYCNHTTESIIFLKIIKYIRKHIDRIIIIGIDNDKMDRDYYMYKMIMINLDNNNINFFWAHNCHISTNLLQKYNLKYIKNKNHKYFCGYYLKNKLKNQYCIILSTSYKGINRFNSYCNNNLCEKRIWNLKYFYHKFKHNENKKYINENKKYQLLTNYNEQLINFSNSYFNENKYGYSSIENNDDWTYILFYNEVNYLKPLY